MRLYKDFKHEFCLEPYLLTVPSVTYIQCIARFRLSSHNLNIELGRHTKPVTPVASRYCMRCDMGVDDEPHFLLQCPVFSSERAELFRKIQWCLPDLSNHNINDRFIAIMSSRIPDVIFQLGKFLHKCLPK